MNEEQTAQTLARLEAGLRTNCTQLIQFEEDLIRTLRRARNLGDESGSPADWSVAWSHHWNRVEDVLQRSRERVQHMELAITSNEPSRLTEAMTTWEAVQADETELLQAMNALREQAQGLNAAAQSEWNAMVPALERHLELIHSCAQSLHLKLELLKIHSKEEVDHLVKSLTSGQPLRLEADAKDSGVLAQADVQAQKELGKEHHRYLGLLDVIQGMFLWVENPEERNRKKLSLD